jgi:hypothetical protein
MATHELYVGGPGQASISRSMYPRPTFNPALDGFKRMTVAAHKGPTQYAITRTLDAADFALAEYLRNNTVAAADVLNLQVIPKSTLLYGVRVRVEKPVAGLTLTFGLSDGSALGAVVDCSVVSDAFVVVGGAWVTAGAVNLGSANFSNVPRALQATVTAIGAAKLGGARIHISPLVSQTEEGQF